MIKVFFMGLLIPIATFSLLVVVGASIHNFKFYTSRMDGIIEVVRDNDDCVVVGLNTDTKELWYKKVRYPRFFLDAKSNHQHMVYMEGRYIIHLVNRSKILEKKLTNGVD
jgi:hypothetical protein